MRRQHEPLRVPDTWRDQSRAFVVQLERLLDDIYIKLEKLENRIAALEEQDTEENET